MLPVSGTLREMKILVVLAGTNQPSNAETLAKAFCAGIHDFDAQSTIAWVRLADVEIDHFTLECYDEKHDQGEAMRNIQKEMQSADGVIIASPVWNFSVPGHLKNFIDRCGSFALDATHSVGTLQKKPFYLLFTGGSPDAGWHLTKRTVSHLPVSIRYFGGTVIGQHYEGRCTKGRGQFGLVLDARTDRLELAKSKGEAFGKIVAAYAKDGSLPLTQGLLTTMFRVGGKMKKALGL